MGTSLVTNLRLATGIQPLNRAFYARSPRRVARDLLGKVLIRQEVSAKSSPPTIPGENAPIHGVSLTGRIVEVEAYLAEDDPAAHSAAGRTARNAVLFGPPGYAYVYFIYGTHYCLNVSCDREGTGGGILFRALEPLSGIEEMARARDVEISRPTDLRKLTSGPGRLCEAFGVTRVRDNGCDLTLPGSLWIGDDGERRPRIMVTPRIGITKASDKPLRYVVAGNRFVSGPVGFIRPSKGDRV